MVAGQVCYRALRRYNGEVLTPDIVLDKYSKEIHPCRFHLILIARLIKAKESPSIIFGAYLKEASWEETLAAALIGHIIFAVHDDNHFDNSLLFSEDETKSGYYYDKGEYMGEYAVACCEINMTLSYMPNSPDYTLASTLTKLEGSMRGRKSARARWEPSTKIKKQFVSAYNNNPQRHPSQAQWAKRFLDELQPKELKLLGANPERNLLSYLARTRKTAPPA